MDHQYTKEDFLDLSENCHDIEFDSSSWLSSTLDSQKLKTESHKREHYQVQKNCNILGVSAEELKIRSELGMKIERDLEEEIKEGIYHLALRLHRIYQERKERSVKESSELVKNRARAHSEVNISIRMDGRTKVEIKETNQEEAEKGGPYNPRKSRPQNVKEMKKVDWVKTLRTGSSPVYGSRTSSSCVSSKYKDKKLSTDPNVFNKWKTHGRRGKNVGSSCADKKILQLGWKV